MGYLLAALVGGFFLFNSQATPQRAERAIEKVLVQRFPGATVDAEVEGKRGRDVLKGRFRRVKLSMAKFHLDSGGLGVQATRTANNLGRVGDFELSLRDFTYGELPIRALDMSFADATFDWKALKNRSELKIVDCGPGTAKLSIAAASLEPMLKTRLNDVQGMKFTVSPGNRVQVTGTRPAPLVNVPVSFSVAGRIEVRNNREIWLADPSATMSGLPLAAPLAKALLSSLNPIYVFDAQNKSPFGVQLTELKTGPGSVEMSANLTFKAARKS